MCVPECSTDNSWSISCILIGQLMLHSVDKHFTEIYCGSAGGQEIKLSVETALHNKTSVFHHFLWTVINEPSSGFND